jgi:hypothetical protein
VVSNVLFGPLMGEHALLAARPIEFIHPDSYDRTMRPYRDRMMARVPKSGGVVAAFQFLARCANRDSVHAAHHVVGGLYTFTRQSYPVPTGVDALICDMSDDSIEPFLGPGSAERMWTLIQSNHLAPADAAGDQVLFLRGARDTVDLCSRAIAPPDSQRAVTYDQRLVFAGFDAPARTVRPGAEVTFHAYWRRVGEIERLYVEDLVLLNEAGEVACTRGHPLAYALYAPGAWPQGVTMRETVRLVVPVDLEPGTYTLGFALRWRGVGSRGAALPDSPAGAGVIRVGPVRVLAADIPVEMRDRNIP